MVEPDYARVYIELRREGVTLTLLWGRVTDHSGPTALPRSRPAVHAYASAQTVSHEVNSLILGSSRRGLMSLPSRVETSRFAAQTGGHDMRYAIIVLSILLGFVNSAIAQLSIGIGLPGVSIGINVPSYPTLVQVPNYPVYYAPGMSSNFFFYDGMYWVYQSDNWYTSDWYNGPWRMVGPEFVPLYVLRVPVRYYRSPPSYFRGWQADAPPRWGDHWGNQWQQQHSGWDQWNRGSAPALAPLPVYQKKYSGDHYPKGSSSQRFAARTTAISHMKR